jgi:ABC-type glycerol-3-phosphate transport system substrate-binding protein
MNLKRRIQQGVSRALLLLITLTTACQPVQPTSGVTKPTLFQKRTQTESGLVTPVPSPSTIVSNPTATSTSAPHLQINPDELRGIQARFWHPWTGELAMEIEGLVEEFNQTNIWGINFEVVGMGGSSELYEQVATHLNDGKLPNLVAASMDQIQSWETKTRTVIGLDGYILDPQWGLTSQQIADIPLAFLDQNKLDERIIAIPAQRTAPVIYYNLSWGQELGFSSPPTSPGEFKTQACAATKANLGEGERRGTGGWIIKTDPMTVISWILVFNPDFLAKLQAGEYIFNTPEVTQSFTFLRQMMDEECAWVSRNSTPYEYFASRQTLLYSGVMEDILPQTLAMQRLQSRDEWAIIPYPKTDQKPMILSSGDSYSILVDSPQKQMAAWLLLRWFLLPKNQVRIIESSGTLPVSASAVQLLTKFEQNYPEWKSSLPWIPIIQAAPQLASWRVARAVLQDAAWQIFQTNVKPSEIPGFLQILDETIPEVLQHK